MSGTDWGRKAARRLWTDRRGAIAPIFALAVPVLVVAVGAGVDTSRVLGEQNRLQGAVDAAGLALGRQNLSPTLTSSQLLALATPWVKANLNDSTLANAVTPVSASNSGGNVVLSYSAQVPMIVMSLLPGMANQTVQASTTIHRNQQHIELALVLDNTGSMAQDNKLGTLKDAAGELVDTLTASAVSSGDSNALKIGVVPFAQTVNVGANYQGQAWLKGASPYPNDPDQAGDRFAGFTQLKALSSSYVWGGCVEDRPMPYDILDTAPIAAKPNTYFVPYFAPDEPDDDARLTPNQSATGKWNNSYIDDASSSTDWNVRQNNIQKYASPKAELGSQSRAVYSNPGPNWGCGVQSLMTLTPILATSDATPIHNELNAMQANGDTEIPVGLVWGWHVLSPNAPFGNGAAYGTANTLKIVVLVTDGQNTYSSGQNVNATEQSYYTSLGYLRTQRISVGGPTADGGSPTQGDFSNPAAALDDRLSKLCVNMQNAGIIIYAVPVEVTDPGIKSRLQNCATDANHYIDATSTAALTAAFQNIAGQISALRVAK